MAHEPTIAYLFSRHPVVSQTFCDTEMLALERLGARLEIHSIHPPDTSFRHPHLRELRAPVRYAPPEPVLKAIAEAARVEGRWPDADLALDEKRFGAEAKPGIRMRNALHLGREMRARGVRHVHVHFANRAAHTALYIRRTAGIPFSFTAHAQDFMVELPPELLADLVAEAAFVVAVSDHTRGLLADRFPDHAGKIHRIYNGIDLARFPASPPPRNPVPVLFSVGRLVPFKGYLHLIRACGLLRNRGVAFQCTIVGEGPQRAELEREIAQLGLEDRVRLPGPAPQDRIAADLAGCDLFVLPCDIEPDGSMDVLPTVITEAMATGRPVVSTPTAGVPELVADGSTGVLVPRADPEALAAALFRLLADHDLRREFGLAARARVEERFRVEQTAAQLLARFREAVPGPETDPPPAPATPVRTLVLISNWPDPEFDLADLALTRWLESGPDAGAAVIRCSAQPADGRLAAALRFLPDAMVLESRWREEPAAAHSLENFRKALPGALDTGAYLDAARIALAIWHGFPGLRHLHAVGTRALLVAWILHRADGLGYSVQLGSASQPPPKVLQSLLSGALGGWCADPARAAALGLQTPAPFVASPASPIRRLLGAAPSDPGPWIQRLRDWS